MDGVVTASAAALRGHSRLALAEAQRRAARTRVLLSDCDGVLTDGGVYVSEQGETLLRFSRKDGLGFERLRELGVTSAIVTRERSPIVERRAAKLGVRVFAGVQDKRAALAGVMAELGVTEPAIAYIGDDINDVETITYLSDAGLTAAPSDAEPEVLAAAHFICRRPGGAGAFRDFVEWLRALRSTM